MIMALFETVRSCGRACDVTPSRIPPPRCVAIPLKTIKFATFQTPSDFSRCSLFSDVRRADRTGIERARDCGIHVYILAQESCEQ